MNEAGTPAVPDDTVAANRGVIRSLFMTKSGTLRLAEIVTSIGIILFLWTGRGDVKKRAHHGRFCLQWSRSLRLSAGNRPGASLRIDDRPPRVWRAATPQYLRTYHTACCRQRSRPAPSLVYERAFCTSVSRYVLRPACEKRLWQSTALIALARRRVGVVRAMLRNRTALKTHSAT